jgi:hypothetical protein
MMLLLHSIETVGREDAICPVLPTVPQSAIADFWRPCALKSTLNGLACLQEHRPMGRQRVPHEPPRPAHMIVTAG